MKKIKPKEAYTCFAEMAGTPLSGEQDFKAAIWNEPVAEFAQMSAMVQRRFAREPARALLDNVIQRRKLLSNDGNFLKDGETVNGFSRDALKW